MRRLFLRGHIRAWGIGLALIGLAALTALQPAGSGRSAAGNVAVLRHSAPASASPVSSSPPSSAASSSPSPTPTSTATAGASPDVRSPLPALIVLATPTPVPVQPAAARPAYSQAEVVAIINAAAQADGVAPAWLISTAQCESNLNPYAYNPAGPYDGLLQFLPSTFRAHGGTDIWDPTQQAQIAAGMFAAGESSQWPVCSHS
jgi:soluble lytic murein transglycosylase-like protein